MMYTQERNWRCTLGFDIRVQAVIMRWMISPYLIFGLFLHKGTSPRTLIWLHEISENPQVWSIKAVVRDIHWYFTTSYVSYNVSNVKSGIFIEGLEYDLLKVVLQQMNMTFVRVPTPQDFEMCNISVTNSIVAVIA